jgi:hypothetical protein
MNYSRCWLLLLLLLSPCRFTLVNHITGEVLPQVDRELLTWVRRQQAVLVALMLRPAAA